MHRILNLLNRRRENLYEEEQREIAEIDAQIYAEYGEPSTDRSPDETDEIAERSLIEAERVVSSAEVYRDRKKPYVQARVVRVCENPERLALEITLDNSEVLVIRSLHDIDESTIQLKVDGCMSHSYHVYVPVTVLGSGLFPIGALTRALLGGLCEGNPDKKDGLSADRLPAFDQARWVARAKVDGDHGTLEARLVQDGEVEGRLMLEVTVPHGRRFVIRLVSYYSDCVSLVTRTEKLVEVELPWNALRGEDEWK
jgi:hypothetical protein